MVRDCRSLNFGSVVGSHVGRVAGRMQIPVRRDAVLFDAGF